MDVSFGRSLKRIRLSYEANETMARKILLPPQKKACNTTSLLQSPLIRDSICDHAYRRAQIFYAQALVYHRKGCDVWRGRTIHQHGKANFSWSSAAHSALLPNLHDTFNGIIKPGSHLYGIMNATVELPTVVNEYDSAIEAVMRDKSITLLNRVSKEGLHPYEATEFFVREMHRFFLKSEKETREKMALVKKIVVLEKQLWEKESLINPTNITDYLDTLQVLGEYSRKYRGMNGYSIHRRLRGRLPWQARYFQAKRPYSKLIKSGAFKKIAESGGWFPQTGDQLLSIQQHALTILSIQREGTVLPPLVLLSGKFFNNQRVPLNEAELQEQKKRLLK